MTLIAVLSICLPDRHELALCVSGSVPCTLDTELMSASQVRRHTVQPQHSTAQYRDITPMLMARPSKHGLCVELKLPFHLLYIIIVCRLSVL